MYIKSGIDDMILCPHPSPNKIEAMLREEREVGVTDKRLSRARWCEGCQLTLAVVAPHAR